MTQLYALCCYLAILLALGVWSNRAFRGTSLDFFVASRSLGPGLLFLSVFGTSMTAFSIVGSAGEAYRSGIGVYGMMASWSGLVHSAVFFFLGTRLWAIARRRGYTTQIQFFTERFESPALGVVLFPVLAGLVIPYVLIGLLGAGSVVQTLTAGAFPQVFPGTQGGVPPWLTGLVVCGVVLTYVFIGGLRATAWANALQAGVFMCTGILAFIVLSAKLGGPEAASQAVQDLHPERLVRGDTFGKLHFASYCFIPLSIAMFPHVYQHWLTARSVRSFRPMVVLHPVCMLLVWLPCVLIGVWATAAVLPDGSAVISAGTPPNGELAAMVQKLTSPLLGGILGAGILAAIMSSLDSQLLAIGSLFTHDFAGALARGAGLSDALRLRLGRVFVTAIAAAAYLFSLSEPRSVFTLGVWCFSAYAALAPIAVAAVYWRRATASGAIASVITTVVLGGLFFQDSGYGSDASYLVLDVLPAAVMVVASSVALVVVSLMTRPPSSATVNDFLPGA